MAIPEPDWIALGNWSPRWARVVFGRTDGPFAMAMIDGSGDDRTFSVDFYTFTDGEWSGHGGLQDTKPADTAGWTRDFAYAYGRAVPASEIRLEYASQTYNVTTPASGWWTFMHALVRDEASPIRLV